MENSFCWFSSSIDRAFSFTLDLEGQYTLDSLEVAVYRSSSVADAAASFTIRPDVAGLPDETVLDTFNVFNISSTQQVMTSGASEQAVLSSGSTYWIVGRALQENVRWNLSDYAMGPYAYRVDDGDWTYIDNADVSAFAIHGTVVPEPTTLLLFGLGGLMLRKKRA